MTIIYLTLGWTAGLLLAAHSVTLSTTAALIFAVGGTGLAILRRQHPVQRTLLLVLAFAAAGALRMLIATAPPPPDALAHTNGQGWRTLEGVIIAEPDVRDTHINLRVRVDTLYHYDTPRPASGSALLQAPRYGEYAYGDRVRAAGMILTPPEFDDFSYRDYLARQGILTWIPNAEVERLSSGHGEPFRHALYALKARAHDLIAGAIPEPQSSLLVGILLGVETGISPEVRDAFNATGSSHVIAISGFNMTLIAGLISRGLGLLWPRRRALTTLLSIATIGAYTILVGANPPVIRATIMSSLLFVAPLFQRRTYVPASLAFAALVMSLQNPYVLWDIGFQLSFAAVLGLALLTDPLEGFFRRILNWRLQTETVEKLLRLLSEPLIVTLAAQITTTPLIALYFGRLSISSLAVNFLILPVQAPLLMLGGLATLLGLIVPVLGLPFYWAAWIFLSWTTAVVRLFARLPGTELAVQADARLVMVFYVALLGGMMIQGLKPRWASSPGRLLQGRRVRTLLTGAAAITLILLILAGRAQPDGRLHVHFLDAGSSNAVLIETPDGMHILVDGGEYPTRLFTALGDHLPFWDREIELLIITQPKNVQVAALPALLDHYRVRQVLWSGLDSDAEDFVALQTRLTVAGIARQTVMAGNVIQTSDGVTLEVLFPLLPPAPQDIPNDTGLVLKLAYGEASFLLMPDLSPAAEAALISSGQALHGAVLQLPSHGSDRVSGPALLDAVAPQVAVVQVAAGNYQRYPAAAVLERLGDIPLYRTDQHGAVTISTDGVELVIYTERPG